MLPAVPLAVSAALHAALIFGYTATHTEQHVLSDNVVCAPGQQVRTDSTTGAQRCYDVLHVQLSPQYEPPAPTETSPPASLPPSIPASYASRTRNDFNADSATINELSNVSGATPQQFLDNLATAMNDPKYVNASWYGRITPDILVGNKIQYKVVQAFKHGNCNPYTLNATMFDGSTFNNRGTAGSSNANCAVTGYFGSERVNALEALTRSPTNTYNVPLAHRLPVSVAVTQPVCESGYSYNSSTGMCDSTETPPPSLLDGFCAVTRGSSGFSMNPFDPDCARMAQQQKVNVTPDKVTVSSPDVSNPRFHNTAEYEARSDNGTGLTLHTYDNATNTADKSKKNFNPDGTGDGDEPFPKEQGDPDLKKGNGTPLQNIVVHPSGGTFTLDTSQVGDGVRKGLEDYFKTDTEISADGSDADLSTSTQGDSVFNRFYAFRNFVMPESTTSCSAALDLGSQSTVDLGGFGTHTMNPVSICPLIEPRENTIRDVFLALWTLASILLFIRLTV